MATFKDALTIEQSQAIAYGENGMAAHANAGDKCLELFYSMGALRGKTKECVNYFRNAFQEDAVVAMQLAFLLRDVRSGTGERDLFRAIMKDLEGRDTKTLIKVLPLFSKYGRWDDLEIFTNLAVRKVVYKLIGKGLRNSDTASLCAKWISRNDNGDKFISGLRAYLKLSPKDFRKKLVSLSSTVEQKMSSKDWSSIDYNKLPSQAMFKHKEAFKKHDALNFDNYVQGLSSGETKVNAATLYPYQIVNRMAAYGVSRENGMLAEASWNALPDFFAEAGGESSILPLIDVSGSMTVGISDDSSIACIDVAVSLGMYVSMKQKGSFQNCYLTFESQPKLNTFNNASLLKNAESIYRANWGGSTDIQKAYMEILNFAKKHKVDKKDMPKVLMVFSDMNFNTATGCYGSRGSEKNIKAVALAKELFEKEGYECPVLVYWNLRHNGTFVAQKDEAGVMTLSGFSPSLLKDIMAMANEQDISPILLMKKALSRYGDVAQAVMA